MSWFEMLRGMHGEGVDSYSLDIRTIRLNRIGLCHGVKVQYRQSLQSQCLLSHIVKSATNKRDRNEWFREKKSKALPNTLDFFFNLCVQPGQIREWEF
jgi:hypothetical protein